VVAIAADAEAKALGTRHRRRCHRDGRQRSENA
jgi:ribosomal protein S14